MRARLGAVPFGTCPPMEEQIDEGKCMLHDKENCILLASPKREHSSLIPRICLRRVGSQGTPLPDKPSLPPSPFTNKGTHTGAELAGDCGAEVKAEAEAMGPQR